MCADPAKFAALPQACAHPQGFQPLMSSSCTHHFYWQRAPVQEQRKGGARPGVVRSCAAPAPYQLYIAAWCAPVRAAGGRVAMLAVPKPAHPLLHTPPPQSPFLTASGFRTSPHPVILAFNMQPKHAIQRTWRYAAPGVCSPGGVQLSTSRPQQAAAAPLCSLRPFWYTFTQAWWALHTHRVPSLVTKHQCLACNVCCERLRAASLSSIARGRPDCRAMGGSGWLAQSPAQGAPQLLVAAQALPASCCTAAVVPQPQSHPGAPRSRPAEAPGRAATLRSLAAPRRRRHRSPAQWPTVRRGLHPSPTTGGPGGGVRGPGSTATVPKKRASQLPSRRSPAFMPALPLGAGTF